MVVQTMNPLICILTFVIFVSSLQVTASAWLNDLRTQIERTRILSTVYRSASALGSRLPSIANAKAKVAGAGAMLGPVSSGTQVVMKRAQSMAQAAWSRPALRLSSWSCMGPRRRASAVSVNPNHAGTSTESSSTETETLDHPISSSKRCSETECSCSNQLGLDGEVDDDPHDDVDPVDPMSSNTLEDRMTEVELWQQLEHELYSQTDEEAETAKEIREEEEAAVAEVEEESSQTENSVPKTKEVHRFFPPGKIMHIITLPHTEEEDEIDVASSSSSDTDKSQAVVAESRVGIFVTPRTLYSKLRLSQTMISDHFMPVYRRQIEKVIRELEKDDNSERRNRTEEDDIVL